jgi:hypothetical protein
VVFAVVVISGSWAQWRRAAADARRTASGRASCTAAASAVATVVLALHVCVLATSAQPLRGPTFEPGHDTELRRL